MCAAISKRVDPWKIAGKITATITGKAAPQEAVIEGSLRAAMPRLEAAASRVLEPPRVALRFELQNRPRGRARRHGGGAADAGPGRVVVRGWVYARLALQCQRCLEDFEFWHRAEVALQVEAEAQAQADDDGRQASERRGETAIYGAATDVLACEPGQTLDLAALVEDELLLSLPFAPRCELAADGIGPQGEHIQITAQALRSACEARSPAAAAYLDASAAASATGEVAARPVSADAGEHGEPERGRSNPFAVLAVLKREADPRAGEPAEDHETGCGDAPEGAQDVTERPR